MHAPSPYRSGRGRSLPASADSRPEVRVPRPRAQRGSALVWAMLFVIITCGMIISHTAFLAANRKDIDARYRQQTLSATFARSGLTDALGWFARQPTQPVVEFRPQLEPEADPPLLDTLDPTLGLVREFEVHSGLWGRYEVRLEEVLDISAERGATTAGSAWQLRARGYVYQREDPNRSFDQAPNRLIAASALQSEMRGIPITMPAEAPLIIDDVANLSVGLRGDIRGGDKPGYVAIRNTLGLLDVLVGLVSGTPSKVINNTIKLAPDQVFGMRLDRLRNFSDYTYLPGQRFRSDYRSGQVVYVQGDLTLDRPLQTDGPILLIVGGNLSVPAGSDVHLQGIVYVGGNADVRGPFSLKGSMIVAGAAQFAGFGSTGDVVLEYARSAVDHVRAAAGRYRLSRRATSPMR